MWDIVEEELGDVIPDVIITLNHISSADKQQFDIYDNIRKRYKNSVLVMMNGHSHREQQGVCGLDDPNCVFMESGCYMYSIGLIKLTIDQNGKICETPSLEHYDAEYDYLETKCADFRAYNTTKDNQLSNATSIDDIINKGINELEVYKTIATSNWFYDKDARQTVPNSLVRLYHYGAIALELYTELDKQKNIPSENRILFHNAGSLRENLFQGDILKENIPNVIPFRNTFMYLNKTLTGKELGDVYCDMNKYQNLTVVDTNKLDYYLLTIPPEQIDPKKNYTIISDIYDYKKFSKAYKYVFGSELDWVDIEGVPNMMEVLEKYLEDYMNQNGYSNEEVEIDRNAKNYKTESTVYLVITLILCVCACATNIFLGHKSKGN